MSEIVYVDFKRRSIIRREQKPLLRTALGEIVTKATRRKPNEESTFSPRSRTLKLGLDIQELSLRLRDLGNSDFDLAVALEEEILRKQNEFTEALAMLSPRQRDSVLSDLESNRIVQKRVDQGGENA